MQAECFSIRFDVVVADDAGSTKVVTSFRFSTNFTILIIDGKIMNEGRAN